MVTRLRRIRRRRARRSAPIVDPSLTGAVKGVSANSVLPPLLHPDRLGQQEWLPKLMTD